MFCFQLLLVLMAQIQLFNNRSIPALARALEVFQQLPAFAHHGYQSPATMVVLLVEFEVVGQLPDLFRQQSDLHL